MPLDIEKVQAAIENCVLNNSDNVKAGGDAITYLVMCETPVQRDYIFAAAQAWVDAQKIKPPKAFQSLLDQLNQRLPLWQNNRDAREAITPILQMAEMADLVRDAMRYRALSRIGIDEPMYGGKYKRDTLDALCDQLIKEHE